jgi:hypothetical protein
MGSKQPLVEKAGAQQEDCSTSTLNKSPSTFVSDMPKFIYANIPM